jgi:hypothetical protein
MRKKWIAGVVLVIGIGVIGGWLFHTQRAWRQIVDRCIDYDPQWLGMLDCYGVVSIWQFHNSSNLVLNNNRSDAQIAEVKAINDLIVENNEMYLIDTAPVGSCAVPSRGKYCAEFQVNGKPKEFGYARADQVPTYLVINIKTGDERFYANLTDAPEGDRVIFQRLLTR